MSIDNPDANQAMTNETKTIFVKPRYRESGKSLRVVRDQKQIMRYSNASSDLYNMPVSSLAASDIIE